MARRGIFTWACGLVALVAGAIPGAASAIEYVGSLHEHSGYSDGWPGSTPRNYYAAGRDAGLDFMGSSEHSDSLALPNVLSEECIELPTLPECLIADPVNPPDSFRKWPAIQEQALAASTPTFTGFRGFEWTSDRFGHINVFFSEHNTNAKIDGGYVSMDSFWLWLSNRSLIGGGSDGIGVFNHPDAKKLSDQDPGANWNDFEYVPAADGAMVGIEVFNDNGTYDPWYARALDKGWHVGAVGAEDLGHRRSDDWGGPTWPKTVIEAADRSPAALEAAMRARDFYAVRRPALRMDFTVDGFAMGSRISPAVGDELSIDAAVTGASTPTLELVTSGGDVVATSTTGTLDVDRPAAMGEEWYFVRASEGSEPVAYSSPVWIESRPPAGLAEPTWLAGDFHVHTCYSHDSYCPLDDDNTEPEEFYTAGLTVGERFAEAEARGLDFLTITDHNDIRSVTDPGFGSRGVIGIPAYENSLQGHAQMLGARKIYDSGDKSATAVNAMADELRGDGGVFQLNHPTNDEPGPFAGCGDDLDWKYGTDVEPDVVEVWSSAVASLPESIAYWERCWLDRGKRIAATGASDSHWASLAVAQGAGNPTTWVLADDRSTDGVLDAIAAGRTTITRLSPAQGGGRLLLEADGDGDGTYEAGIGDVVAPDAAMRVRMEGGVDGGGLLRIRANGETLVDDQPLLPGQSFPVPAIAENGWVRAELRFTQTQIQETFRCGVIPEVGALPCPTDQALAAMTSPIWLEADAAGPDPGPDPDPTPGDPPAADPPGGGTPPAAGKPPRIKPRRGVREAEPGAPYAVAELRCGSAQCKVDSRSVLRARTPNGAVEARVLAPDTLPAGETAPLKLRLVDGSLRRLRGGIARFDFRIGLTSASGGDSRRLKVRLRGPGGRGT